MRRVCFTLDVLTDGSECTGHGTLFLSVWKQPKDIHMANNNADVNVTTTNFNWLQEEMKMSAPLARYAISGLGDATARLCADQRLKLAPTRAVFLPTREYCADGLAALFLALHSAGAPSLHIVTSAAAASDDDDDDDDAMEALAGITLGFHRHMNIMTCHVPKTASSNNCDATATWWKVFEDEYLTVHARSNIREEEASSSRDGGDAVTYLFSFCHGEEDYCTLALLPPHCRNVEQVYQTLRKEQLPFLTNEQEEERMIAIDYVIALDPTVAPQSIGGTTTTCKFFLTLPDQNNNNNDPGLLIRSQQVAQYFHDHMPLAFPASASKPSSLDDETMLSNKGDSGGVLALKSCTSVVLDNIDGSQVPRVLDRRKAIWDRPLTEEWSTTLESLQAFAPQPPSVDDENEIDLEDDQDDDDDENDTAEQTNAGPQLVVLGTGCAAPSAFRGASGYALMFPNNNEEDGEIDVILLDCGEGVPTMLHRNCRHYVDWKTRLKGIWISHAHLDHYGGLPTLLRIIHDAKGSRKTLQTSSSKKPRIESSVPWVVAPPKVLHFLDILLHCHHGRKKDNNQQLFVPRLHHDPTVPPGPWKHFQNVKL
jgi:hypothetical protein